MTIDGGALRRLEWPLADGGRGGAARGRWQRRHAVVLTLTAAGARGLGEAAPLPGHGAGDDALARAEAELAALVRALPLAVDVGRPLAAAAALAAGVREPAARFAIETAVLDLAAQRARTSVAALLAGGRDPGPAPLVVARIVDDEAGGAAAWASGFRTLKLKLAATPEADPDREAARVAAILRAAPHARLRVDVNQGWPGAEVDRRLAALARLGDRLEYVEEPAADLGPRLTAPRACPLALDESLADPARDAWLERALAGGALAALVLKPTVIGGLTAALALAAHARAHGVDAVVSHALEGRVAFAALRELARALAGPRAHGVDVHAALPHWSLPR